jgi:hypothetical protein
MASLPMARVAPASVDAARAPSAKEAASQQPRDAGSQRWQRARLVLDQHQRDGDVAAKPPGQVLPVSAELADLLPQHGLRRGSTVVVRGSTALLLALLAEATTAGSWAAIVGMPDLGLVAAAELGVAVQRLALIPNPGNNFPDVVAALLDGMDLVVVVPNPPRTSAAARSAPMLARRLSARARHRKSVLIVVGAWPGADLELTCANTKWSGLGNGSGHLTTREATIRVSGRGTASRPTTHRRTLPAALTPAALTPAAPTPLRRRYTTPADSPPPRLSTIDSPPPRTAATAATHAPAPPESPLSPGRFGLASPVALVVEPAPSVCPPPPIAVAAHSPTPPEPPPMAARIGLVPLENSVGSVADHSHLGVR